MSSKDDKDLYKPLIKGLEQDKVTNCTRLSKILMDHFLKYYFKYGEGKTYVYKSQLKDDTGSLSHLAPVLCDKRFLKKGENGKLHVGPKLLTRLKRAHTELSGTQVSTYKMEEVMTNEGWQDMKRRLDKLETHNLKMTKVLNAVVRTMINNGDFEDDGVFPPSDGSKVEKTIGMVKEGKTQVLMDDILEVN
jgi:hypothetical protein